MKFDVYFLIRGEGGKLAWMPCKGNPYEMDGLKALLGLLAGNLPSSATLGYDTVGVMSVPTGDVPPPPGFSAP